MISRLFQILSASVLLVAAAGSQAAAAVDKATADRISASLSNPAANLEVESVTASEVPGMYSVQFLNGPRVLATEDGKYFVVGDLYQVNGGELVNLSEKHRDAERRELLAEVDTSDMIVFPAQGETRAQISVFTDVTCFYCQKLHREVPELNKRGVEVRYLAYPRSGVGSASYDMLVTAWCSEDQQTALTRLKNKESVPPAKCDDHPVESEYELGQRMGVRGTPALVTEEGKLIPGYQSADQLMATLGLD